MVQQAMTSPGAAGYPRKRARTRRALMTAGMEVLAEHGPDGTTIGEIARRAQVSPGTVYNHFTDLAALLTAIVDELAGGVEIERARLDQVEHDPAARVAIGTDQLLSLVDTDPAIARAFVTLLATVPEFRSRVRSTVAGAIEAGVATGRFAEHPIAVVTDAVIGAAVQWMRTRLAAEHGTHGFDDQLRLVLVIAGLPAPEIEPVMRSVGGLRRSTGSIVST